jgi:anti-anti-sigma factor
MEIEVVQSDHNILRIALKGKLDANSVGNHAWELFALTNNSKTPVVFDFAGISFISSLGIGMLMSTTKDLMNRGLTLKVENVSGEVERVLRISGMESLL